MPSSPTNPSNAKERKKDLPDPALKWGISPSRTAADPPPYTPSEDSFTPAQQAQRARLRAKGVNPDLKAEMDAKVYGKGSAGDGKGGKEGGFWTKVAGTAMGGGWIK